LVLAFWSHGNISDLSGKPFTTLPLKLDPDKLAKVLITKGQIEVYYKTSRAQQVE